MLIRKYSPFYTPKQIIKNIYIKHKIDKSPIQEYFYKKGKHNPLKYAKAGLSSSYKKPSLLTRIKDSIKEFIIENL